MTTTTITERALVRRINRRLRPEFETLRKCPQRSRGYSTLGDYYQLDTYQNTILATHVDPEAFARDLGVIGPNEKVAE